MADPRPFLEKAVPPAAPPAVPPEGGKVPAFYARRKKRGNELCQILIRNGDVKPEHVRRALKLQAEKGGQIGRILVRMNACSERAIARALIAQVQLTHEAGAPPNLATLARRNPEIAGLEVVCSPARTAIALLLCDVVTLAVIGGLAAACDWAVVHHVSTSLSNYGFTSLALCAVALGAWGWYRPIAHSPPAEIRASTLSVTLVFMSMALVAALRWEMMPWRVITILVFEWALACVLLPSARAIVRGKLAKRAWWGVPVVVLGAGKTGRRLVASLRARPQLGLRPVFVLDDDQRKHGTLRARVTDQTDVEVLTCRDVPAPSMSTPDLSSIRNLTSGAPSSGATSVARMFIEPAPHTVRSPSSPPAAPGEAPPAPPPVTAPVPTPPPSLGSVEPSFLHQVPDSVRNLVRGQFATVEGVPVLGGLDLAPLLASRLGVSYAILAMPGQSARKLLQITERIGGSFPHLLVIPDLIDFANAAVPAREIAGVVGLEVQQALLLRGPRVAKRMMDMALAILGGIFIMPIIGLLALLVKLDSKGPVLYGQKRLGQGGKEFTAFKFRTMYGDGEQRLKALLESDAKLRAEYEEFHKLSSDPRITRVGRVLRKYSLDELPQLFNVLRGEMSLVGPRPYLPREVPEMMNHERIILRAMPGMTGLWQVSDRNATGFAERLKTDVSYVRSWSPWLDLYILARTIGVVAGGTGS